MYPKGRQTRTEGKYDSSKTLLDYFSSVQFSSFDLWTSEEIALTPVLILDQFEEFFTLHAPETIDSMLDFLCKQRKQDEVSISDEVEPFQLQLLYQHIRHYRK